MEQGSRLNETGSDFYGCYLLLCLNLRYKGRTYIGFTVDPNRRIKQHNAGAHKGGAWRTSGRGPWEMVLMIHGFPTDISALQFEWAWQHPEKSRRLRHVERKKSKESAFEFRYRVASEMLRVGPWNRLPLTVRWLKQEHKIEFDPKLRPPIHMPIVYGPLTSKKPKRAAQNHLQLMETEKSYSRCCICAKKIELHDELLTCVNSDCLMKAHVICLAKSFLKDSGEDDFCLPVDGPCPICFKTLMWNDLLKYRECPQEFTDNDIEEEHWTQALKQ